MTKREVRKEAYLRIIKQNESHQNVFDELKPKAGMDNDTLAKIVGAIPSKETREKNKTLVGVYIGLMGLNVVLRCLGILALASIGLNTPLLMLALVFGLVVPGVAIYGAISSKTEIYYSTSALLLFGIFRSITRESGILDDPINLIGFVPVIAAIIVGFILPNMLKTNYTFKTKEVEVNGVTTKVQTVVFEEEQAVFNDNLLDS